MSRESWMWLAAGMGFGAVNTGELLEAYPQGADAVLDGLGSEKLDEILTQKQAEKLASTRPADYALMLAHAESQGIYALGYDDRMYPEMLRSISNPPLLLFVKGDLTLLNGQLSVGMVGARRPSGYGVEAVRTIGRGVALGGAILISGLAAGLDSEAHKAALAVNGPTIACIAFGHENCYPAQNKQLMEVIERYGAVVSEYPPATKPEKPFFLHRNRLIAGLSHALVVTEARKHSGTMSTVNFATDYGRDVFAVPGSIFSELSGGTNAMIRDGAYLAASAQDILGLYGIELPEEELAKIAASQAREGRPASASATPPWRLDEAGRQAIRQMGRQEVSAEDISPPDVQAGEQTLLEALQGQIAGKDKPAEGGMVSRSAAIDAFRRLQHNMPPTDDSELDARNRALDEMVAAVSDDVAIRRQPGERSRARQEWEKQLADEPEEAERVKPFRWEAVEHLSRAELAKKEKEKEPPAPQPRRRQTTAGAYPVRGGGSVGAISAISGVEPVMAARGVTSVMPAQMAQQPPPVGGVERGNARQEQRRAAAVVAPAHQDTVVIPELGADGHPLQKPAPQPKAPQQQQPQQSRPAPQSGAGGAKQEGRGLLDAFRRETDLSGMLRTMPKRTQPGQTAQAQKPPPARREEAVVYSPGMAAHPAPQQAAQTPPDAKPYHPPVRVAEGSVTALGALPNEQLPAPPAARPKAAPVQSADIQFPPTQLAEGELLDTVSDAAKLAFEQLGVKPLSLAQIATRSGLSSGEAMAALTELELAGLSRQLPGRQFVIIH